MINSSSELKETISLFGINCNTFYDIQKVASGKSLEEILEILKKAKPAEWTPFFYILDSFSINKNKTQEEKEKYMRGFLDSIKEMAEFERNS